MVRERSLDATLLQRLGDLSRPHWARTATARRILAALLLCLAVALFFRGDPDTDPREVVVAKRDLAPGRVLTSDDIGIAEHPAGTLPDGAVTGSADVLGKTLAGPARAGEMITDIAVLGPRLAAAATGTADARVVPVRLADPGVAELLREGDRVDVLTAEQHERSGSGSAATTLATDAAVVLVTQPERGRGNSDPVVLLAMPSTDAGVVAGASLTDALAIVLH